MKGFVTGGVVVRFMKYVREDDKGCWLWTGGQYPNGYAKFKLTTGSNGGRAVLGHRFSYATFKGEPQGVINHLCEVKSCVNPAHLADVSQRQNVRYSLSGLCKRGHDLATGDVYISADGKRKCRTCRRIRRSGPRSGDIGEPIRHIELEPIEVPSVVPAEPVRAPEPEKVPA